MIERAPLTFYAGHVLASQAVLGLISPSVLCHLLFPPTDYKGTSTEYQN